jgi:hypothetical protein
MTQPTAIQFISIVAYSMVTEEFHKLSRKLIFHQKKQKV